MAQRNRYDEAGAWIHLMNRGLARRTVFERRADMRYFLAALAWAVRAGWLEVHAFCLLATHFHLLARSRVGEIWRAMRRVQNAYVRRFNIERRRDGPLFRGRFRSKRIRSERYWATVVRYIDHNPVDARLVVTPGEYPFGSASYYRSGTAPKWLTRGEVEHYVTDGVGAYSVDAYDAAFGTPLSAAQRHLVELRLLAANDADDPFDDLVGAAPSRVADWMRRKASLADGTRPGLPVITAATVAELLTSLRAERPEWAVDLSGVSRPGLDVLGAGLLRLQCGLTMREVAARLQCSASAASGRVQTYRQLLCGHGEFFAVAADALVRALQTEWPVASQAWSSPRDLLAADADRSSATARDGPRGLLT